MYSLGGGQKKGIGEGINEPEVHDEDLEPGSENKSTNEGYPTPHRLPLARYQSQHLVYKRNGKGLKCHACFQKSLQIPRHPQVPR